MLKKARKEELQVMTDKKKEARGILSGGMVVTKVTVKREEQRLELRRAVMAEGGKCSRSQGKSKSL
jgi:hypothetical protein